MKYFILILILFSAINLNAQKRVTKTGTISFEGSVNAFEPVKASNTSTTVVLDDKGNLAALVLIKGFRFPIALMQEHFNENYMESDDFPKAILRGTLTKYDSFVKDGSKQTLMFKGILEMHGVKKELELPVKLAFTKNGYELHSNFVLDPNDFKIDIPTVVKKKIADKIKVVVDATLPE